MLRWQASKPDWMLLFKRFARGQSGVSAVEFALILPVLALLLGASVEISGAITAGNRASYVAEALGQLVSQSKSTISDSQMQTIMDAAALSDPSILAFAKDANKAVNQSSSIIVTSMDFTLNKPGCTQKCSYDANVVFSVGSQGSQRTCGKLAEGAASSLAALPKEVFAPGPLIVVDATVYYKPLMSRFLGTEISFTRSSYFRPRYIARVDSNKNCPNYKTS